MPKKTSLTYQEAGVSYDVMDPLKKLAQAAGKNTTRFAIASNITEVSSSRGESAYVMEMKSMYIASVIEGLGTKNLIADEMRKITGLTYYNLIAQDTVAMIINDLITVGALPVNILAYWAAGSTAWFEDKKRMGDLVAGWAKACRMSGAVWGGGETPTLSGIIEKDAIDLGGSATGIIQPKTRLILGQKLAADDVIILFESSGIHANGLTLARKLAEKLPNKYATKTNEKLMFGEALLVPTLIYAKLIKDLFDKKIDLHYMVNITGHGWRKIMRHNTRLTYRMTSLTPVPPVLQFIIDNGPVDEKEAYGNFNMGAGFAIFVPEKDTQDVIKIAKKNKIKAYIAGRVENGPKRVIIEPKNIIFEGKSLQVRT